MGSYFAEVVKNMNNLGIDPVGAVISSVKDIYTRPEKEIEEIKANLIYDNFKFHYENNAYYRGLCDEQGVTPDDVQTFKDLVKIPGIHVARFKDVNSHQLLTKSIASLEHELRSSGTSGIPSISRRDEATINRTVLGIYAMYREFFKFFDGEAIFLAPSAEEMPEMGMVKVLSMFSGLMDGSHNVVKQATFVPEEVIELLNRWERIHTRHLIGPPFMIDRLLNYLRENDIRLKLDRKTKVITLGGWKRYTGVEIDREQFNKECAEYLGIKEDQVRDMYGLVETNFMAIECEQHEKHVPPWVHFSVRAMEDLSKEVEDGEVGRLVILDPTSISYPGFIITEDLVFLSKDKGCSCGRNGQRINYLFRIKGAEIGCCAINLEKHMDENEKSDGGEGFSVSCFC
ncbi:LuxE family acyl-protein synthetase [Peribacillus sp. NPDC096622]|uniref:LuxE/PaaK family acyltransferase n=1 Tax=Peribacillus sp. NPDC096622 TaxID=3364396 RepID=UPI00382BE6B0